MEGKSKGEIESPIFTAAVKGDFMDYNFVAKYRDTILFFKTPDVGNSIVHIAVRHGHLQFIDKAVDSFPKLIRQKNSYGNTPLHEAALMGNKETAQRLISHLRKSSGTSDSALTPAPDYLVEVNHDGDTPFHVALRSRNLVVAEELFSYVREHPQILLMKDNLRKETPLHLFVRYCNGGNYSEQKDDGNVVSKKSLIWQLIEANCMAIYELDSEGLNPLMRAAQYGCVVAVFVILSTYPLSMECRDSKGGSVLHLLRLKMSELHAGNKYRTLKICKKILEVPGVDTLIVSRDKDGNTPLYLAILDRDFDIAEIILERCVEANLSSQMTELITSTKNSEGRTTLDLLTSTHDLPLILKNLMEQALQAQWSKKMDSELDNAAQNLDVLVFDKNRLEGDDYFHSQDMAGQNILHIAILKKHESFPDSIDREFEPFIKKAIERFPKLMYQADSNGATPLHIAARLTSNAAEILLRCWPAWKKAQSTDNDERDLTLPPWKVKDSKGHTPIHEAACADNLDVLNNMINALKNTSDQTKALLDVNKYGETVFHLIARYMNVSDQIGIGDIKQQKSGSSLGGLTEKCKTAGCMRDMDGLTPLLRAANGGRLQLVLWFIKYFPKSINMRDYEGRNVLHHVCSSSANTRGVHDNKGKPSMYTGVEELILSKDNGGNTPLHLAVMHYNFDIAHSFIRHFLTSSKVIISEIKEARNRQGKSIMYYCELGAAANLKKLLDKACRMEVRLYNAAKEGKVDEIKKIDVQSYALNVQTEEGSTILHIALQNNQLPVFKYAVQESCYLDLIYWKDSKGDTPLHLAASLQTDEEAKNLIEICIQKWKEWDGKESLALPHPWTVRNSRGNTYLHEAARFCNYQVIFSKELKDEDINDVNDHGETVLHVIVKYAIEEAAEYLENLSEQMKSLIYIQDDEGFTPVLRAVQYGRLRMAMLLLHHCPHSIDFPDKKGRTILHHLKSVVVDFVDEVKDIFPVWEELFTKHSGVDQLRIAQNEEGNTPLHLAIIDSDFSKVKFLMERCLPREKERELHIVNNDGHSVFDLVSLRAKKELQPFVSRRYVKERKLMNDVMDDKLYEAAKKGENQIFESHKGHNVDDVESRLSTGENGYFLKKTPSGSNIVHIALRNGHRNENIKQFIEKALESYPELSMHPDSNGDTPLHLAAKWESAISIFKLLVETSQKYTSMKNFDHSKKALQHVEPWAVKNCRGNFPIHEALQTSNLDAARCLLECDKEAANRTNDLGDTALHSFAQSGLSSDYDKTKDFVKKLLQKNNQATYMRNDEGLTPLLSAASSGCLEIAKAILECRPQSAYLRDASGRTFLHVLRFTGEDANENLNDCFFKKVGKQLFAIPEANAQRLVQDYDGNTPLHHAIIKEDAIVAIVLTQKCVDDEEQGELRLMNKQGQTIPDLLAEHDVPNEVIDLIQKKMPSAVSLARSSYGIRTTEMSDSANALSVVAGLLATMTFAAAFQVPGGNSSDGFPVLWKNPAFAIFTVANSIAMCSSMLCLFLLLWEMGIGKIHGSLKVLDISIVLLRISFYFTLLTFTSGVFAFTAEKSLWLAVVVCVLGFLTFLLTFNISIKAADKIGDCAKSVIKICSK